jgi:hypothetical protein
VSARGWRCQAKEEIDEQTVKKVIDDAAKEAEAYKTASANARKLAKSEKKPAKKGPK